VSPSRFVVCRRSGERLYKYSRLLSRTPFRLSPLVRVFIARTHSAHKTSRFSVGFLSRFGSSINPNSRHTEKLRRYSVSLFCVNRHWFRFNRVPDPPPRDRLGVTYLPSAFSLRSDAGYADLPLALLGSPVDIGAGSGKNMGHCLLARPRPRP